jgi:predicted porin
MKKHLLAAAIATAIAAPAMAQNVTISGNFDTFMGNTDTGATTAKASTFSSGTDGMSTSEVKFTASEDLGGGMKAGVTLRNYLTSNTGVDESTSVTGNTFDQSYVTLSGNFGSVSAGRIASNASEAFGLGKFGGNIGRLASGNANAGRETSNSVAYTSNKIQGVTVELFKGNETNGSTDGTFAYAAKYEAGALAVGLGKATVDTSSTVKKKLTSAAAQYDFGMFKVGGLSISYDPDNTNSTDKIVTTQLHVAAPLGNGLTLIAMTGSTKTDDGSEATNGTHKAIAVTKALSKRTTVYAAMLTNSNNAGANFAIRGTTAGGAGADAASTIVGIKHSF